jgi:hypothetical protein
MTVAVDAEITALMQCLQRQRHVLRAVEGLSDGALRRPVLPSGMGLSWRMPSSPPHPQMPTWPGGPSQRVSGACTIFGMSCSE